jgi:hypothetical protein
MPKRAKQPKRAQQAQSQVIPRPPTFKPNIFSKQVLRFLDTAGHVNIPITVGDLGALIGVATTTTSITGILGGIRLRRIKMWSSAPSGSAPVTIAIDWSSLVSGPYSLAPRYVSDTSMGSTQPAYVNSAVPPGSAAAGWLSLLPGTALASNILAYLTTAANTIVDVEFDFAIDLGLQNISLSGARAVTGPATVGAIYVSALDLQTSGFLIPQATQYIS